MMLVAAAVVILLAVAILGITLGVFGKTGLFRSEKAAADSGTEGWTSAKTNPDGIVYGGKTYVYNDHLTNYLLLGVDTKGSIQEEKTPGSAGDDCRSCHSQRYDHPGGELYAGRRIHRLFP